MIKVFGCSGEFMLKQQIYFYSSVVRRASIFSIKHINNFKTLFNIERDVYLIPVTMLFCVWWIVEETGNTSVIFLLKNMQGFWYLAEKKAKFRGIFRGKFLGKSANFTRKFGGKLRWETISKKQPILLDFFWQILLKSINFALIWPALVNVSFNRDNHLLFQQQFAREMSEC